MPVVVAIPARDEEALLPRCVASLAAQTVMPDSVVVLLNNTTDGSVRAVRALGLPMVRVLERTLPPSRASAGWARRIAMRQAARLAGPDGVLLCTDADAVCPPDWVAANLRALAAGADAVAGVAELDPADAAAIPAALHEDDARECAYDSMLDEIAALADPDPHDPWPRHTGHSGASIACTVAAFERAGGIPAVAHAEDRAFFAALRATDARVRHAPDVRVRVSGRTEGRAPGGMADTIRRRLTAPDPHLDDRLEPAVAYLRRVRMRRAVYAAHATGEAKTLAVQSGIAPRSVLAALRTPYAGTAWARIEAASPYLVRRPVAVSDLARQVAAAGVILATLRLSVPLRRKEHPGGIVARVRREPATGALASA